MVYIGYLEDTFLLQFIPGLTETLVSIFKVFLVRIFPNSDWIRRESSLSIISPNAAKYGPEKLQIHTYFHAVKWKKPLYSYDTVF